MFSFPNLFKRNKNKSLNHDDKESLSDVSVSFAEPHSRETVIINPLVDPYIRKAASLLEVDIPKVTIVNYIYEDTSKNGNNIFATDLFDPTMIPRNANFLGSFYPNNTNEIYFALYVPIKNPPQKDTDFAVCTPQDLFCVALHEIRHVWQKKYHYEEYYRKNAVGLEVITDIAEIDADAFAIAFYYSDQTPFTAEQALLSMNNILLQAKIDGKKRITRSKELEEEYGLT